MPCPAPTGTPFANMGTDLNRSAVCCKVAPTSFVPPTPCLGSGTPLYGPKANNNGLKTGLRDSITQTGILGHLISRALDPKGTW